MVRHDRNVVSGGGGPVEALWCGGLSAWESYPHIEATRSTHLASVWLLTDALRDAERIASLEARRGGGASFRFPHCLSTRLVNYFGQSILISLPPCLAKRQWPEGILFEPVCLHEWRRDRDTEQDLVTVVPVRTCQRCPRLEAKAAPGSSSSTG